MILSEYSKLYDIVVPKDNELRKLKELVDFSFIYDELTTNYSINQGRIKHNKGSQLLFNNFLFLFMLISFHC